jgi:hypothetical protein
MVTRCRSGRSLRINSRGAQRDRICPISLPSRANPAGSNKKPKLVQAADLIGLLGDPMSPRKANALFFEFEEIGMNRQLGYSRRLRLTIQQPCPPRPYCARRRNENISVSSFKIRPRRDRWNCRLLVCPQTAP